MAGNGTCGCGSGNGSGAMGGGTAIAPRPKAAPASTPAMDTAPPLPLVPPGPRDANGATWYLLRYGSDFLPRGDDAGPSLTEGASYDDARHVLELVAQAPGGEVDPLPGLAVQPDGERYETAGAQVLVVRCDGSRVPLLCEDCTWRQPLGLALDRRGYLYVADRGLKQVVVVIPEEQRVVARLTVPGMKEPVDVAVAADGRIAVADRGGGDPISTRSGRVWWFSADFQARGSLVTRNAAVPPLPAYPRPITVGFAQDGTLLVADANHPRLLRFSRDGAPQADLDLATAAAGLAATLGDGRDARTLYGDVSLRYGCTPGCPPEHDAGVRLATTAWNLRLLHLTLGRRYAAEGAWVSAILDGGRPGTRWHRIDLDGTLPAGTWVEVATASADDPLALPVQSDDAGWDTVPDRHGEPFRFLGPWATASAGLTPDDKASAVSQRGLLVPSGVGRHLRVRLRLGGDGLATPRVEALAVRVPQVSYLDDLPALWRRDPDSEAFLRGFLALFENSLTRIEDRRDTFWAMLAPNAAPPAVLEWLAELVDLTLDADWPLARRRALVAEAISLYRIRGTPAGLIRYVEVYTGIRPVILEDFLSRPRRAAVTGVGGTVLGLDLALATPGVELPPDEALFAAHAHRFTVVLPLPEPCDASLILPVVERIVSANKPAHTIHTLRSVAAGMALGDASLGIDWVVGEHPIPRWQLGGAVLGGDMVLGHQRPVRRPPEGVL